MRTPSFMSLSFLITGTSIAEEKLIIPPAAVVSWEELVQINARLNEARTQCKRRDVPAPKSVLGRRAAARKREIRELTERFELPEADENELTEQGVVASATCSSGIAEFYLSTSFEALSDSYPAPCADNPPDTMGAAGPNHLMTMLNSEVRIQSKSGTILSTVCLADFWQPANNCATCQCECYCVGQIPACAPASANDFAPYDPHVVYDSLSGRWLATAVQGATLCSQVLFAISSTSDPLGSWTFYTIDADASNARWADYPTIGGNATWIALVATLFSDAAFGLTCPAGPAASTRMWVVDKATAINGGSLTLTIIDPGGYPPYPTMQPCLTFDAPPGPLYIVDDGDPIDPDALRVSKITGTGPAPIWSVVGLVTSPTPFSFIFEASQRWNRPPPEQFIETWPGTRTQATVFRNSRIWVTHHGGLPAGSPNRTAIFWYEIDPSAFPNPIVQSGVIDGGPGVHHYFPSLTVNCANDVVIGFTRSFPNSCESCADGRYPEGVYAMRRSMDPLGATRPIRLLKAGEDSRYGNPRWGDYSATVIDPTDDMTFWTIQEYEKQRVCIDPQYPPPCDTDPDAYRWGTWWGKINPCLGTGQVTAKPVYDHSLWRTQKNTVRLTFSGNITVPSSSMISIQQLSPGGVFGSNLASSFTFTVENDGSGNPRVLKIRETTPVLAHRAWYAIRNTGAWTGVCPFQIHYVVQRGDADDDGQVTSADVSLINAHIGPQPDDSRYDINGDGFTTPTDVSLANFYVPSSPVRKPPGH